MRVVCIVLLFEDKILQLGDGATTYPRPHSTQYAMPSLKGLIVVVVVIGNVGKRDSNVNWI